MICSLFPDRIFREVFVSTESTSKRMVEDTIGERMNGDVTSVSKEPREGLNGEHAWTQNERWIRPVDG